MASPPPALSHRTAVRSLDQAQRPMRDGSRTMTIPSTQEHDAQHQQPSPSQPAGQSQPPRVDGVLRLRGANVANGRGASTTRRRVVWQQGTVDNEGLGRKKSKICCIYHKPRAFDESSSSESPSSSSSDSDSASDSGSTASSSVSRDGGELSDGGDGDGARAGGALRDRMRASRRGGDKGKARADDGGGGGCDHDHGHDHDHGNKSKRLPGKKAKSQRRSRPGGGSGGSRTVVVTSTEQETEDRRPSAPSPEGQGSRRDGRGDGTDSASDEGGGSQDGRSEARPSRMRVPNAYERGVA